MMGGPGFAGGLAQGLQAGQERMMEMQRLKLMQDFNKSRMKQMEVEDQLKQMQVESLFKRMAAEERLPSLQENVLGPQAAPLDLGAQGPMPEPSPDIDRRKLVSFLQVAQDAGQDPMQLLQLMGMADPRIHAISESLKPATVHKLAPGETLVEVGGATQAQTSASQPTDRNMLPEEAAAQAAERARPLSQEERMAQTAQQAPTGGMPDIVPGLKPPAQPTVMPGEGAPSQDTVLSKPQAASTVSSTGRPVKQLFAAPAKPEKPPDVGDRLESAAVQYAVTTYGRPMRYWELVQIDPIAAQKLRQQTLVDEPTQIASARVQATIEQQKNQLLSPEEANKLGIPFGATKQDAMGIMPITAHQRETLASYDTARVVIEDIAQYSDKVNRAAGGLSGRAQQSMKLWGAWTQSDPDAALLMSKAGELASIARSLGEKGALANQDVARAAGLVPSVTDTRDVAIRKLKDMAKIIDGGEANYRKSLGMDARKAPSSRREDTPSDTSSTIQAPPGLTPQQAEVYQKAYAEERQRKQQQMTPGKPSYQSGTSYVPQTGPAQLHEGEIVIPKGQADKLRQSMIGKVEALADLFGSYIDRPNDPGSRGSLRDNAFFKQFDQILPQAEFGYTPGDFGFLQQNPQYRGLRMILPQSGGSYGESAMYNGSRIPGRIMTQGPTGLPDPNDPHLNGIPLVPANYPPDRGGLREMLYGEMIKRGYPVLGGNGDLFGFQPGFNPVGFGQRDTLRRSRSELEDFLNEAAIIRSLPPRRTRAK